MNDKTIIEAQNPLLQQALVIGCPYFGNNNLNNK